MLAGMQTVQGAVEAYVSSLLAKYLKLCIKNWAADRLQFRLVKGRCSMANLELYEGVVQQLLHTPYLAVRSARISALHVVGALDRVKHDPFCIQIERLEVVLEHSEEPCLASSPLQEFLRRKAEKSAAQALAGKRKKGPKYSLKARIVDGLRLEVRELVVRATTKSCTTSLILANVVYRNTNGQWEAVDLQQSLPGPPKDNPAAPYMVYRECRVGSCSITLQSRLNAALHLPLLPPIALVVRTSQRRTPASRHTTAYLILDQPIRVDLSGEQLLLLVTAAWELLALARRRLPKALQAKQEEQQRSDFQTLEARVSPEEEAAERGLSDSDEEEGDSDPPVASPVGTGPPNGRAKAKTVKQLDVGLLLCQLQLKLCLPSPYAGPLAAGSSAAPDGVLLTLQGLELRRLKGTRQLDVLVPWLHAANVGALPGGHHGGLPLLDPVVCLRPARGGAAPALWPHLTTVADPATGTTLDFGARLPALDAFRAQLGGPRRSFFQHGQGWARLAQSGRGVAVTVGGLKVFLDTPVWCALYHHFWRHLCAELPQLGAGADITLPEGSGDPGREAGGAGAHSRRSSSQDITSPTGPKASPKRLTVTVEEVSLLVPANPFRVKGVQELLAVQLRTLVLENQHSPDGALPTLCVPGGATLSQSDLDRVARGCPADHVYRLTCPHLAVLIAKPNGDRHPLLTPVAMTLHLLALPKRALLCLQAEAMHIALDPDHAVILLELLHSYRDDAGRMLAPRLPALLAQTVKAERGRWRSVAAALGRGPKRAGRKALLEPQWTDPAVELLPRLGIFCTVAEVKSQLCYSASLDPDGPSDPGQRLTTIGLLGRGLRFARVRKAQLLQLDAVELTTTGPRWGCQALLRVSPPPSAGVDHRPAVCLATVKDGRKATTLAVVGLSATLHAARLAAVVQFLTGNAPAFGCSPLNVIMYYRPDPEAKDSKTATKKLAGPAGLKHWEVSLAHARVLLATHADQDAGVGLRLERLRLYTPERMLHSTAGPAHTDPRVTAMLSTTTLRSISTETPPLARALLKRAGWCLDLRQCAVIGVVPTARDRSPAPPAPAAVWPAEYRLVDPFDVVEAEAPVVAQFVTELLAENPVAPAGDRPPAGDWLPPGLTLPAHPPAIYAHVRSALRSAGRQVQELRSLAASLGVRKAPPKAPKHSASGSPRESPAVQAEELIADNLTQAYNSVEAADQLLADCLRHLGPAADPHAARQAVGSARAVLAADLRGAVGRMAPVLTKGLLRQAAEETAALQARVQRLEQEAQPGPGPPPQPPERRLSVGSQPGSSPCTSPRPQPGTAEVLAIREQNRLYKVLLAEHGQAVREAEKARQLAERQNRMLRDLLTAHGLHVPPSLQDPAGP